MALTSMTGFADLAGGLGPISWSWEARSVNNRGLDLRVRLPEGFESLDAPVRAAASAALARGSIQVGLRLGKGAASAAPRLNPSVLEAALVAAEAASDAAAQAGIPLAPMTAADLLGLRGVMEAEAMLPAENPELVAALTAQIEPLFRRLKAARVEEGAALTRIIAGQVSRIGELAGQARETAEARSARTGALIRARVEALLSATQLVDEARLAQELATMAVRADITEELDRLEAHVAAGRELLSASGPVGRRLDFLTQEFNREVNTLCSKAGAADLTAIGLEMKVVIDQMREQVQNVE